MSSRRRRGARRGERVGDPTSMGRRRRLAGLAVFFCFSAMAAILFGNIAFGLPREPWTGVELAVLGILFFAAMSVIALVLLPVSRRHERLSSTGATYWGWGAPGIGMASSDLGDGGEGGDAGDGE